jgi:hypothetical protein
LANTIVWGLGVGTLMTIFMIPAAYVIVVEDILGGLRRRFGSAKESGDGATLGRGGA